jgi:GTPase SAR1 family protein
MINNSFAIFGKSGSGKTTFINEMILPQFPEEKIFCIDYKEGIKGNVKRLFNISDLLDIAENKKNSVFIFDDISGNLRKGNNLNIERLKNLLGVRRHDNNYYIFVYHSIFFFPQVLEYLIDWFIFFETGEKKENILNYFTQFNESEALAASMKKDPFKYAAIKK